jgi:hypothetical protein
MQPEKLRAECQTFAQYLIGQQPSAYVVSKYLQAHMVTPELNETRHQFDAFLLEATSAWPHLLCLVDPYSSAFAKTALVRKKLILLLSILETSSPSHEVFDAPDRGGKYGAAAALLCQGVLSMSGLCLAAVLFPPLYLGYRLNRLAGQVTRGSSGIRSMQPVSNDGSSSDLRTSRVTDEVSVRVHPAERVG